MAADELRPPIPATCAARPTIGGLVIPWANVQLADGGVDFRSQHESRVQLCWIECRCQLCGHLISKPPIVFLGGPRQLAALQFDEPPLHPECAVYASRACPMVAGRIDHYATGDVISNGHRGEACVDPGCDCGGWVPTPGLTASPGGDPAHDWYAVYVADYSLGVTENRPDRIHAGVIAPEQVLAVRHISTPGVGLHWTRLSTEQLHALIDQKAAN